MFTSKFNASDVRRWFWNSEIVYFWTLKPVFVKYILRAIYLNKFKSPLVSDGFCSILVWFFINFWTDSWVYMNDIVLGMNTGYITTIICLVLLLFYKFLLSLWKVTCWFIHISLSKTCKCSSKTKHNVGIIKPVISASSAWFILAQNQEKNWAKPNWN